MGGRAVALVLLTLFAGGAALAFAQPEDAPPTVEAVVLVDVSRTVDAERRCPDVEALARRFVEQGHAGTLHLWRTGARRGAGASAGQPLPVERWTLARAVRLVDPLGHAPSPVPAEAAASPARTAVPRESTPRGLPSISAASRAGAGPRLPRSRRSRPRGPPS